MMTLSKKQIFAGFALIAGILLQPLKAADLPQEGCLFIAQYACKVHLKNFLEKVNEQLEMAKDLELLHDEEITEINNDIVAFAENNFTQQLKAFYSTIESKTPFNGDNQVKRQELFQKLNGLYSYPETGKVSNYQKSRFEGALKDAKIFLDRYFYPIMAGIGDKAVEAAILSSSDQPIYNNAKGIRDKNATIKDNTDITDSFWLAFEELFNEFFPSLEQFARAKTATIATHIEQKFNEMTSTEQREDAISLTNDSDADRSSEENGDDTSSSTPTPEAIDTSVALADDMPSSSTIALPAQTAVSSSDPSVLLIQQLQVLAPQVESDDLTAINTILFPHQDAAVDIISSTVSSKDLSKGLATRIIQAQNEMGTPANEPAFTALKKFIKKQVSQSTVDTLKRLAGEKKISSQAEKCLRTLAAQAGINASNPSGEQFDQTLVAAYQARPQKSSASSSSAPAAARNFTIQARSATINEILPLTQVIVATNSTLTERDIDDLNSLVQQIFNVPVTEDAVQKLQNSAPHHLIVKINAKAGPAYDSSANSTAKTALMNFVNNGGQEQFNLPYLAAMAGAGSATNSSSNSPLDNYQDAITDCYNLNPSATITQATAKTIIANLVTLNTQLQDIKDAELKSYALENKNDIKMWVAAVLTKAGLVSKNQFQTSANYAKFKLLFGL